MNHDDLRDPEFQEKLKSAKTPAELADLAREEGVELSDEQLDGIAGGSWNGCSKNDGCGAHGTCPNRCEGRNGGPY